MPGKSEVIFWIMTDWFVAKIDRLIKLNDVEEKKEILTEIKIKLLSLSNNDLDSISKNLDLGKIFTQLSSQDRYNDFAYYKNLFYFLI